EPRAGDPGARGDGAARQSAACRALGNARIQARPLTRQDPDPYIRTSLLRKAHVSGDLRDQLQQTLAGTYRLERELGGGGMSRVFVATDTALDRKVVIKVLPPDLGFGVSLDRFRREIQLAAQLQHPHIVGVLSAG